MFSYENISQNKEIFKSTTWLETDGFQVLLEFLDTGPRCENIKFYNGQNNNPKSFLKVLNLEKKIHFLAIDQFCMYLSLLRNGFTTRILSRLFDISKSTESR